jgi:transcriptional regulator GlxA family with amidase domain
MGRPFVRRPSPAIDAQEAPVQRDTRSDAREKRHIGLLLFDGVEELDAVGPWEVLSYWTQAYPEDGWTIACLSHDGGPVRAAKSLVLGAHHPIAGAPPLDVLIHPGGPGTRPMLRDEPHLDWVREQRARVPLMTSVCTGSLVYAAAGLLVGRRATTHWASLNLLSELDPTVITDVDARFVDDGDLITSAGVSAGIDMALHLVARLTSVERARAVRREIQYDPMPPV